MIYIVRNNQRFGPYNDAALLTYVNAGQILLSDIAYDDISGQTITVREALNRVHLKPKIQSAGGLLYQIRNIGSELIFPRRSALASGNVFNDNSLILLAAVGLAPSVIMLFPIGGFLVFYFVALYFSAIWGLFFYYLFKTPQVKVKTTLLVFFITQICMMLIWNIFGLSKLNPFYLFVDAPFPFNAIGYICGVGLTEEFVKAIPLLIIARQARGPMIPQTLVFYGLMSGIGFGVFEGVEYQISVNAQLDYTSAFFMNIARLTSLPFLHAIWCGIAGYFIAFAKLYPKYRLSLYVIAIAVPATLHGLYDTFCGSTIGLLVALPIMFTSVLLLITYLRQGVNYQSRLRQ